MFSPARLRMRHGQGEEQRTRRGPGQGDPRIKGPPGAPSGKETGRSRSQLSLRPSLLLQTPLGSAPPQSCSGRSPPRPQLCSRPQAVPARCSVPTGSLVMTGWQRAPAPPTGCFGRKQQVGSEQQYKCFFLQPNSLPPLRSQGEETSSWDFPAGPTVKTAPSNAGGEGSIPGQGAKIPAAT